MYIQQCVVLTPQNDPTVGASWLILASLFLPPLSPSCAQGFSIQALFGIPSGLAVLVIGYYLLGLDLDNYLPFWIISFSTDTICMLFLLILMPESMPDSLRKPLEWLDLNPFRQYWSCLKVVFGYPLLICELDMVSPYPCLPLSRCERVRA